MKSICTLYIFWENRQGQICWRGPYVLDKTPIQKASNKVHGSTNIWAPRNPLLLAHTLLVVTRKNDVEKVTSKRRCWAETHNCELLCWKKWRGTFQISFGKATSFLQDSHFKSYSSEISGVTLEDKYWHCQSWLGKHLEDVFHLKFGCCWFSDSPVHPRDLNI